MKRRITLSLISLFVLFTLGTGIASLYVIDTTAEMHELVKLHEIEQLRRHLVINVQAVQADLYMTHTVLAPSLTEIVANVAELDESAAECTHCHHRQQVATQLEDLRELIEEYKRALSFYITASANRDRINRIELEAAAVGDRVLRHTEMMSEQASARLGMITTRATRRIIRVTVILLTTLGLTFLLGIAVSVFLVRSVTGPVQRLVGATRIIASGGLGHRTDESGGEEFAELARNFNRMSGELKDGYEQLRSANVDLQREINERRDAERARERLQQELLQARKMEALGTLSAGVAHEFNNLLQVIRGCVDHLNAIDSTPGNPIGSELEMIEDAVKKGAELTRRLLVFSSKVDVRTVPIRLNERVHRVREILARTLPGDISVHVQLADDLPPVQADAAQLEQVLMNLALNARDSMPDGGVLRIETTRERTNRAGDACAGEPADWVVLRVSDDGHGMDEEIRQHIFDPFFTTKRVGVGTGLGLAMVYGIVTSYGGRIDCTSRIGLGTSFDIRLPAVTGDVVTIEPADEKEAPLPRGTATILLVDDEPRVLELARRGLEHHGYVVHAAESGEKALELFRGDPDAVDLVVLDLSMPGMGGRQCLAELLQVRPDVKVLVSTGYGSPQHEEELLAAGARGFLAKPHRLADVLREVETALAS